MAYNKHGPGVSTQDVAIRTLSDGKWFLIVERIPMYLFAFYI